MMTSSGAKWILQLIGGWRLGRESMEYELPKRQQRLIALLAVNGPMKRSTAARLLWPEGSDVQASNCLRGAISQVSSALPGLLVAEPGRIQLSDDVEVDLRTVRGQLDGSVNVEGAAAASRIQLLSRGELLPGWYDEWVLEAQDEWRTSRVDALQQLAAHLLERGDTHGAVDAASSVMQIDPLDEEAQELVLRAQLAEGNRALALRGYADFNSRCLAELGLPASFSPSELFGLAFEGSLR
ncbi:AfsR/SARP family transcriptional regulator [Arthrobacter sp. USHLN218]|uniref:AfsR/SARP family transcriptional regulator n=1 Tax=Arthrobacter sp. USHLN218 TaxID=3081232 RepID=UPI003019D2ED